MARKTKHQPLIQELNGPTTGVEWVAPAFDAMINILNSGIIQVGPNFQVRKNPAFELQPQPGRCEEEDK